MGTSRRFALPLTLFSLAMCAPRLAAQDREPQALEGLRSVTVLVERTAAEDVAGGVDTIALRHQAEDAVQKLGITLVPPGARDSAGGVLYVNAFAATNPERSWYGAYVELEVMQPVTIDRTQYSNAAVSAQSGVSRELKNPALDNSNMDGSNWGDASITSVYGAGGRGTPKAQNSAYTP